MLVYMTTGSAPHTYKVFVLTFGAWSSMSNIDRCEKMKFSPKVFENKSKDFMGVGGL